ncbi:DUF948 domain-containing protein [Mycoplasma parvum]|uniref:Uncharacterized protein n=1 Tax=Mycoplasma parvum str. Indiana TaxID=1403316 RepID=U5NFP4_9MOLU|nr:DUF948 domain-containing protein [Mycoplasma parvum]AGX88984.1 hypothetical protein PRV_01100 [Mycoplasma parvum str. Indiana]
MILFSKLISWILGLIAAGSVGSSIIPFKDIKESLFFLNKFAEENKDNLKNLSFREDFSSIEELKEKIKTIKDYLDDKNNSLDKLNNPKAKEFVRNLKTWINKKDETKKEYIDKSRKIDNLAKKLEEQFNNSSEKLQQEHFQNLLSKYSSFKGISKLSPLLSPLINSINEIDHELREFNSFEDLNFSTHLKGFRKN